MRKKFKFQIYLLYLCQKEKDLDLFLEREELVLDHLKEPEDLEEEDP